MKFTFDPSGKLSGLVRQLSQGLIKLDFIENFLAFESTLTIPATSELKIANELPFIPEKTIITDHVGNGLITRGDTTWTKDFLYLQNEGAESVTIKVIFMR